MYNYVNLVDELVKMLITWNHEIVTDSNNFTTSFTDKKLGKIQ